MPRVTLFRYSREVFTQPPYLGRLEVENSIIETARWRLFPLSPTLYGHNNPSPPVYGCLCKHLNPPGIFLMVAWECSRVMGRNIAI